MNEPKQPIDRQTNFDWPKRMERDQLIALIAFKRAPFRKRNNVSPPALKGALNRINRFSVNFEGVKAIGDAIGLGEEQARRAIKVLERHHIIIVENKWNPNVKKKLNHYRIDWNVLRLIVENQKKVSGETNPTFFENQSDISHPTNPTFANDQSDISHPTSPTLGTTVIEKELKRGTTTETEWNVVVVSLKKNGVHQREKAIAEAKERGDSPDDVLRIIERTVADPSHRGKDLGPIVYNQVCTPSKVELVRPSRPKPDRERIWKRVYNKIVVGRACTELDQAAIEAQTNAEHERELAEWEKEQKNPFGTLATEPTR